VFWSKELSKAAISQEILQALGQRPDLPAFQICPSEQLDFLIVSASLVIGVQIILGHPDSTLSGPDLARLEKAAYTLSQEYQERQRLQVLMTNLKVSPRFQRVLADLGVRMLPLAHAKPEAALVAELMRTG
jgi:hypothetical protein